MKNVWQEIGLTEKPKLVIDTPAVVDIATEDGLFDFFSLFSDRGKLTLNVELDESFSKMILGLQNKEEMNRMVELLLSKAFDRDEIISFLNSEMKDSNEKLALRGNVQLLKAVEQSFVDILTNIPLIDITEETIDRYITELELDNTEEDRENVRKVLESYNSLIREAKEKITSFIRDLFSPLERYLYEDTYYYRDYLRIQLTFNIAGALADALSDTFKNLSFELSDPDNLEMFFSSVVSESIENCYLLVLNLIGRLASPLAAMDQLASRYGEILEMPDVAYMVEFVMGSV